MLIPALISKLHSKQMFSPSMPTQLPSLGLLSPTSKPNVEPTKKRPECVFGGVACRCRRDRPSPSLTWRRWRRPRLRQLRRVVEEEEEEEDALVEAVKGQEDVVAALNLQTNTAKQNKLLIKLIKINIVLVFNFQNAYSNAPIPSSYKFD